jgi:hypothetical protein
MPRADVRFGCVDPDGVEMLQHMVIGACDPAPLGPSPASLCWVAPMAVQCSRSLRLAVPLLLSLLRPARWVTRQRQRHTPGRGQ